MIAYFDEKLKVLGENKFYIFGPLTSLTADLILIYYVTNILLPQMLSDKLIMTVIKIQNGPGFIPPPDSLQMIRGISSMGTGIMLFGFFIFNCVVAYNCYKRNNASLIYLKGYTLSTVILSIVELGTYLVKLNQFNFYTFITMILYFFVYYGLRYFGKNKLKTTEP